MSHHCVRLGVVGFLVITTAIGNACAQQSEPPSDAPPAAGPAPQVADPQTQPVEQLSEKPATLEAGDPAPPLSITQWLNGAPIEKFEADSVYVVEFWATWCGPCRVSMPHISALQEQYGDKVHFIGVTREPESTVQRFLDGQQSAGKTWREAIKYRLAIDSSGKTDAAYMRAAGENGIPCAFVVGKDGVLDWIGHPVSIDSPLAQVVAGQWNRAAFIAQYRGTKKLQQVSAQINVLCRSQEWDKALGILEQLEKEYGSSAASIRSRLSVLTQAGRTQEAAPLQEKLVEQMWDSAQGLNEFAWNTALGTGERNLALALKAAERASVLTNHADAAILDTLARVYYEQGQLDEALKWQREAAKPSNSQMAIIESLVKYETEKAMQLDPSDPKRQAELERIERLTPTAIVLRAAGGRCQFARGSDQIITSVTFENTLDIDKKLEKLKPRLESLDTLEHLVFTRMHRVTSPEELKKGLPPLPPNAGVTDAGLVHISGLKNLKTLQLHGVNISDAGLEPIGQLAGLQSINIIGTEVTDEGLAHLSGLSQLRMLQLWTPKINGSGFRHLKQLASLAVLDLGRTPITDEGLEQVRELPSLFRLNLSHTKVTDAGLKRLRDLQNLQWLELSGTQITDAGLEHLQGLANLKSLDLSETGISGAGLKHLAGMKQLTRLQLRKTSLGSGSLEPIAGLAELQFLMLDETQITDDDLKHVHGLTNLSWLTFVGTPITDAGLQHLTGLTKLRTLGRYNTQVTPEGYAKLKQQLPNLR